ncbi:hypothetical protein Q5752_000543 [Cryptotrichosporon argae]
MVYQNDLLHEGAAVSTQAPVFAPTVSTSESAFSSAPFTSSPAVTTIRRAVAGDAGVIATLGGATFKATYGSACSAEALASYLAANYVESAIAAELAAADRTYFVAEVAGDDGGPEVVAGFTAVRTGTVEAEACLAPYADAIELQRLYVDEAYHGRGVARALVDAACAEGRARGFRHIWLGVWENAPRPRRFYEKCGFKTVGTHAFSFGTEAHNDLIVIMPL